MYKYLDQQDIFKGEAIMQATFTAATTDILTANAHGFIGGEILQVSSATTLPAGLVASTDYYVIKESITTNTFKVALTPDGTPVDVTDTGTGTHTLSVKGHAVLVRGFRHVVLRYASTGTSNSTIKIQGSTREDMPQFSAASTKDNPWDYLQIIDLEDASAIDGDTGIVVTGDETGRQFEVNTNGMTWVCANYTAWSAGKVDLSVTGYSNA